MFGTKHPATMPTPVITIRHMDNNHVFGYQEFSFIYARGFDQNQPGVKCLAGDRDPRFGKTMAVGMYVAMGDAPAFLHAIPYRGEPIGVGYRPAEGMNFMVELPNGYQVLFEHAKQVHLRPVAKGFGGLPNTVTESPAWRFGKQVFGFSGLEF